MRRKAHILLPLACDLNLVITSETSRVVNSCSFMDIILFPYFNSTKGVKKTMVSGNSRIRSSISPVWLDCSIRVYLDFALRKHGKLNNPLPQFLLCLHKPTSWIDTYIDLCENRGWELFSRSHVLLVFFFFFFFSTGYLYSTTSLTSDSSTKLLGNQIPRYESYAIFLVCIKRGAIASHNLLSRYIENKHKVITFAFCKGNIWENCW